MHLVQEEFLEVSITLSFLLSFLVLFWGPNTFILGEIFEKRFAYNIKPFMRSCIPLISKSTMTGNVRNNYFHFSSMEPEDLGDFIFSILVLLGVDLLSMIIYGILLKKWCGINMLQVYLFQQKEFGYVQVLRCRIMEVEHQLLGDRYEMSLPQMSEQMFIVENMFCSLAVACAIDFTLGYITLLMYFMLYIYNYFKLLPQVWLAGPRVHRYRGGPPLLLPCQPLLCASVNITAQPSESHQQTHQDAFNECF